MPTFGYAYRGDGEPDIVEDPSDYADPDASLQNRRTWEWMHPLDEVLGALRDARMSIDVFTEHYQVPWRIFPITVPQGDGMFGWPAERWLPLSYEVVATAH